MCKQRCIATLPGTDGTCYTMVVLTLFRCSEGSGKHTANSAMRQLGCGGLTRRLRRGRWGCRPEEGSTFFRSERKYQRKPAARHSGKKAFIAHFGGGARNVARKLVGELTQAIVRARARLFPPSKWAGLFPSAAYRRSAPPQLAWDKHKWRCLGYFGVAWMVSPRRTTGLFFCAGLAWSRLKQRWLGCFDVPWIFS